MINVDMLIVKAQRCGMTQEDIADITGTSQPTIARLLSGTGSDKSAAIVDRYLKEHLQYIEFDGMEFFLKV